MANLAPSTLFRPRPELIGTDPGANTRGIGIVLDTRAQTQWQTTHTHVGNMSGSFPRLPMANNNAIPGINLNLAGTGLGKRFAASAPGYVFWVDPYHYLLYFLSPITRDRCECVPSPGPPKTRAVATEQSRILAMGVGCHHLNAEPECIGSHPDGFYNITRQWVEHSPSWHWGRAL